MTDSTTRDGFEDRMFEAKANSRPRARPDQLWPRPDNLEAKTIEFCL